MFFPPPLRHRLCLLCILAMWRMVDVSAAIGDNFHEDVYLRERLLQRAENYLNSCEKAVIPYAMVVRGLLHAGIAPDHPFVRSKTDILLQLAPCSDAEAARQREVARLIRVAEDRNALSPSKHETATLQAAIVSDYSNDHYKRFGVVRLPQRFPGRSNDAPLPEHVPVRLMTAVPGSPNPLRSSDVVPMLTDSDASSCSSDRPRPVVIGKLTGYILVAQTVRLRN